MRQALTQLLRKRFFHEIKHQKVALIGLGVTGLFMAAAILAPVLPIADPFSIDYQSYQAPGERHIMGTDNMGRDMFSRVLWGTRISLLVGLLSAGLSAVVGIVVGAVAGYYGGWVDDLLSRITDIFLVIPIFFLLILVVSLFGSSIYFVIFAIGAVTWPRNARIMRAQSLSLKNRPFVTAAIIGGSTRIQTLFSHVVPNGVGPVLANSMLLVGSAILMEAGLSFLGLGDPEVISWGQMIRTGQQSFASSWWMTFFPGLALLILVSAVNYFGDGLSIVLNPKMRRR